MKKYIIRRKLIIKEKNKKGGVSSESDDNKINK